MRYWVCVVALVFVATALSAQQATEQQADSFLILPGQEWSAGFGLQVPSLTLSYQSSYIDITLAPQFVLGTEVQSIGLHSNIYIRFLDLFILRHITLFFQSSYFYSFNNLGGSGQTTRDDPPEPSHTGFFSGAIVISVGEAGALRNSFVPLGNYNHNILFQYEYFLDTLGTSQALGIVGYYYAQPTWTIGALFENDSLGFMAGDQFRTYAVELNSFFAVNDQLWGVGLGVIGWVGTKRGSPGGLSYRGQTVDVSKNYGGRHSHGILYLAGYYDAFKLSIGVDSDQIRTFFQDSIHYFINRSNIAAVANNEWRFYIQLIVNPRLSLY